MVNGESMGQGRGEEGCVLTLGHTILHFSHVFSSFSFGMCQDLWDIGTFTHQKERENERTREQERMRACHTMLEQRASLSLFLETPVIRTHMHPISPTSGGG